MNKFSKNTIAMFVSAMVLAACGGGGGGNSDKNSNGTSGTDVYVDTTGPALHTDPGIMPANGATDVETTSTVTVRLNEQLLSAGIKVTCDSQPVAGKTTVYMNNVTFKADNGLPNNATCTASLIAAETKDLLGNAMTADVGLSTFTVKNYACPIGTSPNTAPSYNGTSTVAVCNNIYIDPTVSKDRYGAIINSVNTAVQTVSNFYGGMLSTPPDVVVCQSDACLTNFLDDKGRNVTVYPNGVSGKFTAPRVTVILATPEDYNLVTLAHEFTHVELHARTNGAVMNAWFNEGLATYVGGQPECTTPLAKGIDDLRKLDDEMAFVNYTATTATAQPTYCQARNEVAAWVGKNGKSAVNDLLSKISQGQEFYSIYGTMLTQ